MNCTYQGVEKRRSPIEPESDAQYIRNLEDRVKELESILQPSNFRQTFTTAKIPKLEEGYNIRMTTLAKSKQAQNTIQVVLRAVKTL